MPYLDTEKSKLDPMPEFRILLLSMLLFPLVALTQTATRPAVVISTDIGGSDPDDYQSMVHLLMYADRLDIRGLVSSPPGEGRVAHIQEVIDAYAQDYGKLKEHGPFFPTPDILRRYIKQGATEPQNGSLPDTTISEGARWIVEQAMAMQRRPLYILVWGSITDVAQALQYRPAIKDNIRVYSIGSWNTEQDPKARDYLYQQHPDLWWIENNTTFRGMYMGGFQKKKMDNAGFVEKYVKDAGALGKLFWEKKKDIKMGDTPSVLYLLNGNPDAPDGESWGGTFKATDHGPQYWTDDPEHYPGNLLWWDGLSSRFALGVSA